MNFICEIIYPPTITENLFSLLLYLHNQLQQLKKVVLPFRGLSHSRRKFAPMPVSSYSIQNSGTNATCHVFSHQHTMTHRTVPAVRKTVNMGIFMQVVREFFAVFWKHSRKYSRFCEPIIHAFRLTYMVITHTGSFRMAQMIRRNRQKLYLNQWITYILFIYLFVIANVILLNYFCNKRKESRK